MNTNPRKRHKVNTRRRSNQTRKQHPHNQSQQHPHNQSQQHPHNKSQQHPHNQQHPNRGGTPHNKGGTHQQPMTNDRFRNMLLNIATTTAAKFTSGLGNDNDYSSHGERGKFDMYLFAQSWAPRFCCTSEQKCILEKMKDITDLSPHGLWPVYHEPDEKGHTYPAYCHGVHDRQSGNSQPKSRMDHEWEKHGTCTNLSKNSYFKEENSLDFHENLEGSHDLFHDVAGDSVDIEEVWEEYGGETFVALKTDAYCRLEEVTTCWEKQNDGTVGKQTECPEHVLGSARNSAVVSGCRRLWVDGCGKCQFITKKMLKVLRTGVGYTPKEDEKQN